ncbi:MAG: DUF2637 domain-containing protein, partial [Pseudonocardia sp.]|nr:DUF2637 domain-containing protein [Pseudonocardia sp.]
VRWAGLAVVLAAAAVLSFAALRDLALAVSIPPELAWLLPVAVDAGAAVSCACWLARELPADAARFARAQTWLLLGGTVAGNAAQLGMHAALLVPPWWVAVLVGAIPPAVVGGTVHLAVLVGRAHLSPAVEPARPDPWTALLDDVLAEPWDHTIARWAANLDDTGQPIPSRDQHDEILATDLRATIAARSRPLTQDEVRDRYGVGAGRAARLRAMAERPPAVEQVA